MKRGMLLVILILAVPVVVPAQTSVTIGGHYWYAQPSYSGEAFEGIDVGAGNMFGPYVSLRAGRLVLGGSYFFGSFNWDYTDLGLDFDIDIHRSDLNVSLGFALFPRLTVFGAIKRITLAGDDMLTVYDEWNNAYNMDYEQSSTGMLYGGGVSGAMPLGVTPLFFFYSVAYLAGTMEFSEALSYDIYQESYEGEADVELTALTLGLGYRLPQGLVFTVGFRADYSGEGENAETIQGVMATLAYTINTR